MHSVRFGVWVFIIASAFGFTGCGGAQTQKQLDQARDCVQVALDTWKSGENANSLKSRSLPIEFYDDDWQQAARLLEYELIKTYCETDGSPRCTVALVVQYAQKKPVRVQVTYQVVTKQNVVIARDPFS